MSIIEPTLPSNQPIHNEEDFRRQLIAEGEKLFRENINGWRLDKKDEASPALDHEVRELLVRGFHTEIANLLAGRSMRRLPDEMREDFHAQAMKELQAELEKTRQIQNCASDSNRITMQLVGSTLHAAFKVAGLLGVDWVGTHKFKLYEHTPEGFKEQAEDLRARARMFGHDKFGDDVLAFSAAVDKWRLDRTTPDSPPLSGELKQILLAGYYDITSSFIYSAWMEKTYKNPGAMPAYTSTWWKKVTTFMRNSDSYAPDELDHILSERSRDSLLQRMRDGPAHVLYDRLCDCMEKDEGTKNLPDKNFLLERLMESTIGAAIKTARHYDCMPCVSAEHFLHRDGTSFKVRYAGESVQR